MAFCLELRMKGFKPWLVIGLVFFAGIAVGVLGMRAVIRRPPVGVPGDPQKRVEFVRDRWEKEMVADLNLTPEQQTNVHQIFLISGEQMRKLHNDFEPKMKEIFATAHTNIAAQLTPEQREKFEKFTKERRERFKDRDFGSHHGKRPPLAPPPNKP